MLFMLVLEKYSDFIHLHFASVGQRDIFVSQQRFADNKFNFTSPNEDSHVLCVFFFLGIWEDEQQIIFQK